MNTNTQGIYAIVNSLNGNAYVGSSVRVESRIIGHKSCLRNNRHRSKLLQQEYRLYGLSYFEFIILEVVNDYDLLASREKHWIDLFGTYNTRKSPTRVELIIAPDGTRQRSSHVREKIRLARQSQTITAESNHKRSSTLKGRVFTPDHLDKIKRTKICNGSMRDPTIPIVKPLPKIRVLSEECRTALSIARRKFRHTPESKAKISAKNKGLKRSPEFCQRMKDSHTPERDALFVDRMVTYHTGRKRTEEIKQNMRLRCRRAYYQDRLQGLHLNLLPLRYNIS